MRLESVESKETNSAVFLIYILWRVFNYFLFYYCKTQETILICQVTISNLHNLLRTVPSRLHLNIINTFKIATNVRF